MAVEELRRFTAGLGFVLDQFQVEACAAVEAGRSVLLAAPTGAGKTVVGEFAVHLALATGRKAFYTTPTKALSNQKYTDLVRRHGAANVGLLTGDSSVNGEAPVVVMTTEVLRNMMYASSPTLAGLGYVVMDEVHYLADRFRGAVWEEVIIHLPEDVLVVSLSATVSNAEEFGAWLTEVRGDVAVVVSEHRPVPLWQHMMVGGTVYDLFTERGTEVNPELLHAIAAQSRREYPLDAYRPRHGGRGTGRAGGGARRGPGRRSPAHGPPGRGGGRPGGVPSRAEVVERLDREGLLPAITFVFSRVGCDAAVAQLLARHVRLIPEDEGELVRDVVEERVAGLADEDLGVLGYADFVEGLSRGYAAHHAGMLPTFREVVEELFSAGRVRAVFATETLALGINMPARTVVLERLVKFNGEAHVDVTPAEYTQLTGRAGRRGIDVEGHAVVLWDRYVDPVAVAGLASTRTYPLRSSFRPTYTMAVSLVAQFGRDRARELLESSFAQFQADRAVVGLVRAIRRNEEALAGYAEAMRCDRGDFAAYAEMREQLRRLEKDAAKARSASVRAAAAESLERLRVGDVICVPAGRRAGYAVVVRVGPRDTTGAPAPSVVTEDRRLRRLTSLDVPVPVQPVATIRLPKGFDARSPRSRRDIATTLRMALPARGGDGPGHPGEPSPDGAYGDPQSTDARVEQLRRRLRDHPCHSCPDRESHSRWAERWWRQSRETDGLRRSVESRTSSVARTFDRICALLEEVGYLGPGGTTVTDRGERLRRLYTEKDLLAAECIREGVWALLDPPGLAAVVSTLVHEARGDDARGQGAPRMPRGDVHVAWLEMLRLWEGIAEREREHGLPVTSPPDGGIADLVYRWASGHSLESVLGDAEIAPGDFVRRCKQVVDVLDQIGQVAETGRSGARLADAARAAGTAVRRGVVAADRLD